MSLPLNWPSALDALANPSPTQKRNDPGFELDLVVARIHDLLELMEARFGVGTTGPTPTAGTVYGGTGAGTAGWRQVAAPDIAAGAVPRPIAEVVLGAPNANISITNIPQTYRHLQVEAQLYTASGFVNTFIQCSSNGTTFDGTASYDYQSLVASAATVAGAESFAQTRALVGETGQSVTAQPIRFGFPDYASTGQEKGYVSQYGRKHGTATTNLGVGVVAGFWRSGGAAVRGLVFFPSSGQYATGSRVTVYGLPL